MVDVQHELDFPDFEGPRVDGADSGEIAVNGLADNLADVDGRRRDTEDRIPEGSAELDTIQADAADLLRYEQDVDTKLHPSAFRTEPTLDEQTRMTGLNAAGQIRARLAGIKQQQKAEADQRKAELPMAEGPTATADKHDIDAAEQASEFADWAQQKKRFNAKH